jgi:carbamoyl-phosphate synthase large subunit
VEEVASLTSYDKWFLEQIKTIIDKELEIKGLKLQDLNKFNLYQIKKLGFSDAKIAELLNVKEQAVQNKRHSLGVHPSFKRIDTCAGEFDAKTPYMYSTYSGDGITENEDEASISNRKKVIILGSGPNRIGQGIEFDYACVHGVLGSKECGWETIMINNNPETVSTDFNLADKLYFEPVYLENVLDIIIHEKPDGVILQLGGQTALKLAKELNSLGVKILGTSFDGIDTAEDRERFYKILDKNNIPYPKYQVIDTVEKISNQIFEFPLLVRPSYVIGGQRMKIIYNQEDLINYCEKLLTIYEDNTIIIDKFLSDAIEVESDVISQDGSSYIIGIMEHIDKAGVHSGDSSAYLPTKNISPETLKLIQEYSSIICQELKVIGLINIQFVIKDNVVYVIEANPRSSRTVPFISKAYGVPYIKIATGIILGHIDLENFKFPERKLRGFAIKKPIFSTHKFNVDIELGPEMKSTGECIIFEQ